MKSIAVIYGSSTGNTKLVAELIKSKIKDFNVNLLDVSKAKPEDVLVYDNLILGTSTWGIGDLQDDWDTFIPKFKKLNLSGKNIALFGLGDSASYSDSFVDGMGIIYDEIKEKDVRFCGEVPIQGYSFSFSKAVDGNNFVGLAIDEDNEGHATESRVDNWLNDVLPNFN